MGQRFTYTYDKCLKAFFIREVETDKLILKCNNEIVAVTFIHDMLVGLVDPNKIDDVLDMTVKGEV